MPRVGDTVNLTGPVSQPPEQPGRTFHILVSGEKAILRVTPAGGAPRA